MARVSGFWKKIGTAIEPAFQGGADLLLRGVDRYLNFGQDSGETGYGIRDNGGVLQFKNSAGVWTNFGAGGGGGSGDVVGPASATDNAIARFDGTTGKLVQGSEIIVDDRGSITQTGSDNSGGFVTSDSTARFVQETYQKVEFPGHFGEVQRIIWRDKLAKPVIAFQDGADANFADPLSKAWLVAHNLSNGTQPYTSFASFPATVYGPNTTPAQADWYYFDETANRFYQWTGISTTNNGTISAGSWVLLDVADELYGPRHQHFSIETTDDGGENLYTRWAIQYDKTIPLQSFVNSNYRFFGGQFLGQDYGNMIIDGRIYNTNDIQLYPTAVNTNDHTNLVLNNTKGFRIQKLTEALTGVAETVLSALGSSYLFVRDTIVLPANSLGIGKLPSTLLEVAGSDANTTITTGNIPAIRVTNENTTDNNASEIAFTTNDLSATNLRTSSILGLHTSHVAGAMSGAIAFLTRSAGTFAERMRLRADGNLGIGTTNPQKRIHVVDTNANAGVRADSTTNNVQTEMRSDTAEGFVGTLSNHALRLFTNGTSKVTVLPTGEVGIGKTNPSQALDVVGSGAFTGDVTVADEAYDATAWNGSLEVPTKNAIRDKIESMTAGSGISEELAIAYAVAL